jgi:hypothetical protein
MAQIPPMRRIAVILDIPPSRRVRQPVEMRPALSLLQHSLDMLRSRRERSVRNHALPRGEPLEGFFREVARDHFAAGGLDGFDGGLRGARDDDVDGGAEGCFSPGEQGDAVVRPIMPDLISSRGVIFLVGSRRPASMKDWRRSRFTMAISGARLYTSGLEMTAKVE